MKNRHEPLTRVIMVLLTSSLTGCVAGGVVSFVAAALSGGDALLSLRYGPLAGALIGVSASGAFMGLSLNAARRPWLSFSAVGLIILAGTAATNAVAGLSLSFPFIATIAAAEAIGFLATVLWLRSYRRWNGRLKAWQQRTHESVPPEA